MDSGLNLVPSPPTRITAFINTAPFVKNYIFFTAIKEKQYTISPVAWEGALIALGMINTYNKLIYRREID
jgi:hypothetical protein